MSDRPLRCKMAGFRPCGELPAYRLIFTLSTGGVQLEDVYCRGDVGLRKDQILAEGGQIISVEDLEAPPAPPEIVPVPVGLDAIDPPAATPFRPNWAVHPGEILGELCAEQQLTKTLAAAALGWHGDWVGQVIDGHRDLTLKMAADLARVFGLTARAWMRLQERYSEWRAEQPAPAVAGGE